MISEVFSSRNDAMILWCRPLGGPPVAVKAEPFGREVAGGAQPCLVCGQNTLAPNPSPGKTFF